VTGASRQKKLRKYEVTIRREVEYTCVVEVEARSTEEARDVARDAADNADSRWLEGGVLDERVTSVKIL
jgi:hypothetical protein